MNDRFNIDNLGGNKLVPGLILVAVGVFALLGNFGFNLFGNLIGALLFGGAAYFLYREGRRTNNFGMRLAALPLAGLALAALLPGSVGGALFLALIGLAFAFVWRTDQERWWAVIPAGTFASLAAVAGLGDMLGRASGFVFLGGLALTFYALMRLKVNPQPWAVWPAGALAVLALLSLMGGAGWLLPVLLIGGGAVLLMRGGAIPQFRTRRAAAPSSGAPTDMAPPAPQAAPAQHAQRVQHVQHAQQDIVRSDAAAYGDVPATRSPATDTPVARNQGDVTGAPLPDVDADEPGEPRA